MRKGKRGYEIRKGGQGQGPAVKGMGGWGNGRKGAGRCTTGKVKKVG